MILCKVYSIVEPISDGAPALTQAEHGACARSVPPPYQLIAAIQGNEREGKDMKVLAVCGLGIGSSIILKINVGKILDELGVKDYQLDVADIGSAQSIRFDMAVTDRKSVV